MTDAFSEHRQVSSDDRDFCWRTIRDHCSKRSTRSKVVLLHDESSRESIEMFRTKIRDIMDPVRERMRETYLGPCSAYDNSAFFLPSSPCGVTVNSVETRECGSDRSRVPSDDKINPPDKRSVARDGIGCACIVTHSSRDLFFITCRDYHDSACTFWRRFPIRNSQSARTTVTEMETRTR